MSHPAVEADAIVAPSHAPEAQGDERARLWSRWSGVGDSLDAYATRRSTTPVVVLGPRSGAAT